MILAAVLSAAALLHGGDFPAAMHAYQMQWQANHADSEAALALAQLSIYDNDLAGAQHWLGLARGEAPQDPRVAQYAQLIKVRSDSSIDQVGAHDGPSIVPFVQTDPLPMVHVKINGQDTIFLIDTGAPNVVVDTAFAKSLGLPLEGSHQGTFAGGKHATVQQTTVSNLTLGSWTLQNVPASVLPIDGMMGKGVTVGGVLGTALFSRFLTTLDYHRGRLILRDPGDSSSFEGQAQAAGATIVPMWLVGDHFVFVRAHANDGPEGLFNVDTGGTFGLQLTKDGLDGAHITVDSDNIHTGMGGGGVTTFVPFAASVTLGGLTKSNLNGVYTPQGDQFGIFPFEVTGTISHQFFLNMEVTFDFRAMKLVVL